jgi:hypothetical protein
LFDVTFNDAIELQTCNKTLTKVVWETCVCVCVCVYCYLVAYVGDKTLACLMCLRELNSFGRNAVELQTFN